MNRSLSCLVALLPMFAVACAAEATSEETASDDAALGTATITQISISRSAGFIAPSPLDSCLFRHNGRYEVNLVTKTVKGEGCAEGEKSVTVDRTMTAAETATVVAALKKVRATPRPVACPTDGPENHLTVKRGERETRFTDPNNACFDATGATALDGVLAAVEKLATVSEQTLVGTLASAVAIGGETTGQVIQTEAGQLELEFAPGSPLGSQFTDGRKAVVVGVRVDRAGVEIPVRNMVLVTDMLVCPASSAVINCMPINQTKACESGNRFWIQSNCEGVTYLD
jgi:hypothetical protein